MAAPTSELYLLGGFRVRVNGRDIPADLWRRRRAAELVKILALSDQHRLHREQLMEAIWPQLSPGAAAGNLRKAVHFARKALGAREAITTGPAIVELFPGHDVTVDAQSFVEAAIAALQSSTASQAARVAARYTGELLPDDRYEQWAFDHRERLRALALRVFKKAELWDRALAIDPADEEAHRALMNHAMERGDRTAAIRQFEKLRARLRIDLGMSPDRDSVALYEQALASDRQALSVSERARQALARGAVLLNTGDLDGAEENGLKAQRLAFDNDLNDELGQATALLSIVANLRGRWRDVFRSEFAEAVRRPDETAAHIFDGHLCVTEFHLQGPDGHRGIVEFAEQLRELAQQSGSAHGEAVAEMLMGEAMFFAGDLDQAEQHLHRALARYRAADAVPGQVVTSQRLAECALERNNPAAARRLNFAGLELAQASPMAPHLVVRMREGLVRAADQGSALSAVRSAEDDLRARVVCPPCGVGLTIASANALARAGEVAAADQRLTAAAEVVDLWSDGPWHAALIESRGIRERATGNSEEAARLLKQAAEKYRDLHRPRDAARCLAAAKIRD